MEQIFAKLFNLMDRKRDGSLARQVSSTNANSIELYANCTIQAAAMTLMNGMQLE
jgi:hypothetical protein